MSNSPEIETIKQLYSALNRNEIQVIMNLLDPEVERVEFPGTPSEGSFRGLKEMEKHFRTNREKWAEGGCEPEAFEEVKGAFIVTVHVRVRLKESQDWIEGYAVDVFSVKNDKIREMHTFLDHQAAVNWINQH